jgi:hypothetical protein
VRRLNESGTYPAAGIRTSRAAWAAGMDEQLADVLRSALHDRYADASDEEMDEALANVLDSMSPAEASDFASALHRIGRGVSQVISDPAFSSIAQTALPILGGAAGTMIGGPVGTALGSKLGSLAASALPTRPASSPVPAAPTAAPAPAAPAGPPVQPTPAVPAPPTALPAPGATATPAVTPPAPGIPAPGVGPAAGPAPGVPALAPPSLPESSSPIAAGSAAAAQGLVLTQQPDVLRSLLATALGEHGCQTVSGIPVAQVLELLSHVFGKAAADADELMYLGQQPGAAESASEDAPAELATSLYTDLLGADNLELAAVTGWDWLDQ